MKFSHLLILGALSSSTFAQQTSTPLTFGQQQQNLLDFRKTHDLPAEKGWKWKARWESHYTQRSNLNGLYDTKIMLQGYLNAPSSSSTTNRSQSSWLPVGPQVKPPSHNAYSSHGVARINCVAFHPTNSNILFVGVAQGGIWKTTNSGQSWTPINDGLPILRVSDIAVNPQNPDEMYVCLGDFEYNAVALNIDDRKRHTHYGVGVYKTIDGGQNWIPTGHTLLQEDLDYSLLRRVLINPNNPSEIIIAGFEGIWKSVDSGANWIQVKSGEIFTDLEQDFNNPATLYAASSYIAPIQEGENHVYVSYDFGTTWLPTNFPAQVSGAITRIELASAPSNSDYLYALAAGADDGFYALYQSVDGGFNWTIKSDYTGRNILSWGEGIGEVGGQGSYDLALIVDPSNENYIYAGGVNAWGSNDGGENWDGISYWLPYYGESLHADQHQFKYNPADGKFYVCNDGGVIRTDSIIIGEWDMVNWNNYTWPTVWEDITDGMQITSFYRVSSGNSPQGELIAGAQDNSTFYFDGNNWVNCIGGDGMDGLVYQEIDDVLFGSSQYGNFSRSFNKGLSFESGVTNSILMTGEDGEWTTPIIEGAGGSLFVGYGNLWRSDDIGGNWSRISDFPDMPGAGFPSPCSAIAQSKSDASTFYVAKRIYHSYNYNAQLWVTHNDGTTWQNITAGLPDYLYFTSVEIDASDPDKVWVTCGGFEDGVKVFFSDNSGTSWQNISGVLPNLPVNAIIQDERSDQHLVYIATDRGVYFKADSMQTWESAGINLPNVIVSDLDLNYTTGQLYAATFGAGIWKLETGNGTNIAGNVTGNFNLLPNPNNGRFIIDTDRDGTYSIEVLDIMGRKLYSESKMIQGKLELELELNSGVYFLTLEKEGKKRAVRFVRL